MLSAREHPEVITTVRAREAELERLTAQIERQRICAETERDVAKEKLCVMERREREEYNTKMILKEEKDREERMKREVRPVEGVQRGSGARPT